MDNFSNYFKSKENRKDLIIALIVILFFSALVAYLLKDSFVEYKSSLNTNIKADIIVEDTINKIAFNRTDTMITKSTIEKRVTNSSQMISWIDTLEKNKISNTTYIIDHSSESIELNIDSEKIKSVNQLNVKENIKDSLIINKDTSINNDKTISSDLNQKQNNEFKRLEIQNQSLEDASNYNSKCVIILGAFSNYQNFLNLKNNLLKTHNANDLYLGKRKGYHAIGVYINCKEEALKLIFYRNKYTKSAWLLHLN